MGRKTWVAYAVTALMLVLGVGACSGRDDASEPANAGGDVGAARAPAAERRIVDTDALAQPESQAAGGSGDSVTLDDAGAPVATDEYGAPSSLGAAEAAALPSIEPHVIKTAALRIEVGEDGFREAVQKATAIADARGGFVLTSSTKDEKLQRGAVTIRVPAGSFESALADAEAIGDVTAQTVTGEDVGQEFVDLESRLRNSTAQEAVLLRLYDRATSVVDTIRIQREVQDVQLQIEQMRGRLRFLEDRTSLSTITMELVEEGAPGPIEEAKPAGTIARAWDQATDAFLGVIAAGIVVVGAVLPIALLLGLVVAGVRVLRPRFTPNV